MTDQTRAGTVHRTMTAREWSLLAVLSVLWGGAFFFTGVALRDLPPVTLLALRVGIAALALIVVIRVMGVRMPRERAVWRAFAVMGLINSVIPFFLLIWSQTEIPTALAAILNATTPLSTAVVAHVFTADEKLTANRVAGVLIGLVGVAVMIGPAALEGFSASLLAQLAAVLATVSYAFGSVYGRTFRRLGVGPLPTATGQLIAASAFAVPMALIVDRPWHLPMPGLETWLAVVAFAVLSTSLAFIIYFRLLATAGATNLVLVTFLIPISAIVLGVAVLGERLDLKHLLGMALIGLGLAAIDGRLLSLLRRRAL
jgi:drug/metabolite transporter (DMT)-like permease